MARKLAAGATFAAYLSVAWLGGASLAAYERSSQVVEVYPWNDPIDVGVLWSDMLSAPLGDVVAAWTSFFAMPLSGLLMLGLALAAVAHITVASARTLGLLTGALAVCTPYGLLGLFAFSGPYDGEWLGEGWGLFQAFTVWWLVAVGITAWSWTVWRRSNVASLAEPTLNFS